MSHNFKLKIGRDFLKLDHVSILPWTDVIENIDMSEVGSISLKSPGTLDINMINKALAGGSRLKITGPMNGSDLKVLRSVMGLPDNIDDEPLPSPIHYLDMSGVKIVRGGEPYFYVGGDTFTITEDDIIPIYAFYKLTSEVPVSIVLPDGITKIDQNAFTLSSIGEITLPKSLRTIESFVFAQCRNLKRLVFPEGFEGAERSCMGSTTSLEYLYLPYSMSKINHVTIDVTSMKTLKFMMKPEFVPDDLVLFGFFRDTTPVIGEFIDCDLYLSNEHKAEVGAGNTWKNNTWRSITFVDGSTLK